MVADVDASEEGGECAVISAQRAETRLALLMTNGDAQGTSFHVDAIFTAKLGRSNRPIVLTGTASASSYHLHIRGST